MNHGHDAARRRHPTARPVGGGPAVNAARVEIEAIEPGSREDLLNRADPGCELCEGFGRVGPAPCLCTEIDPQ